MVTIVLHMCDIHPGFDPDWPQMSSANSNGAKGKVWSLSVRVLREFLLLREIVLFLTLFNNKTNYICWIQQEISANLRSFEGGNLRFVSDCLASELYPNPRKWQTPYCRSRNKDRRIFLSALREHVIVIVFIICCKFS